MNFFKPKTKSPAELVKVTREAIVNLEKDPTNKKQNEKASEDITKNLRTMKFILYGDSETEPNPELGAQLAQEVYTADLLLLLVNNLPKVEFEAKKDAAQIFNNLLRRQIGTRLPTVEYICKREAILFTLVNGTEKAYTWANTIYCLSRYGFQLYDITMGSNTAQDSSDVALNSGMMLRECIKHEALAKIILFSDLFYKFFGYVELSVFDIAADAFATFKDLLTRHKQLVVEYLEAHYGTFFEHYDKLLDSENYVTRRQSLKLLGELLLDRANFNIMTRYISDPENLKRMMNLLRSKSRNIQFEAFHVFKVFVANPNKPEPIVNILLKNKEKLIDFLGRFHNDRTEDEQFNDEKAYLIKQISILDSLQ